MKLKVLVVAGDGIGPEVTGEAVRILRSVAELGGYDFEFRDALIGGAAIKAARIAAARIDSRRRARKRCSAARRSRRQ